MMIACFALVRQAVTPARVILVDPSLVEEPTVAWFHGAMVALLLDILGSMRRPAISWTSSLIISSREIIWGLIAGLISVEKNKQNKLKF